MAINPNEDTEFNDALRKHGILPPKEAPPPSPSPPASPTLDDLLDEYDLKELQEISEDAPDAESERLISQYRRQRIADEKKEQRRARFGRVYPIGREDYTREVTEGSKINEDGDEENGTGVICFLYKEGLPRSDRTSQHIRTLAERYPRTKFVSIVGNKCIPDLPDGRVPMILVYRKGEIKQQLVAWAADRERRLEELEAVLLVTGALDLPDRPPPKAAGDEDSSDDDLPSEKLHSAGRITSARHQKNVRSSGRNKGDSDSEFEFDI